MTALQLLDYGAVFVFALTGGLAASRAQLDLVGFIFVAALTAVGGGTIRDVLLDRHTIFWIGEPRYVAVATVAAVLVFFAAHVLESRYTALRWLDAAALAIAVPAGTGVAIALDQPAAIAVFMGIATGCFGGLMRDVVCNEVPLVLKQGEIYVTAALAGALAGIGAWAATGSTSAMTVAAAAVTFGLRAGSLAFGWKLPVYRARPPRS